MFNNKYGYKHITSSSPGYSSFYHSLKPGKTKNVSWGRFPGCNKVYKHSLFSFVVGEESSSSSSSSLPPVLFSFFFFFLLVVLSFATTENYLSSLLSLLLLLTLSFSSSCLTTHTHTHTHTHNYQAARWQNFVVTWSRHCTSKNLF